MLGDVDTATADAPRRASRRLATARAKLPDLSVQADESGYSGTDTGSAKAGADVAAEMPAKTAALPRGAGRAVKRGRSDGAVGRGKRKRPDDTPEFQKCEHVTALGFVAGGKLDRVARSPALWMCEECGKSEELQLCLHCGYVGCGRHKGQHSLAHYQQSREKTGRRRVHHCLAFALGDHTLFCYECDEFVLGDHDNSIGEIALIRETVASVQSQEYRESTTRSHRVFRARQSQWSLRKDREASGVLPGLSTATRERHHMADKEDTARGHRRRNLLRTMFAAWRNSNHLARADGSLAGVQSPAAAEARSTAATPTPTPSLPPPPPEMSVQDSALSAVLPGFAPPSDVADVRIKAPQSPVSVGASAPAAGVASPPKLPATPIPGVGGVPLRGQRTPGVLPGRAGLRNIGNTCFINSVMQAFGHTSAMRHFFLYEFVPMFRVVDTQELVVDMPAKPARRMTVDHTNAVFTEGASGGVLGGGDLPPLPGLPSSPPLVRQTTEVVYTAVMSKDNKTKAVESVSLCTELHRVLRLLWSGRWAVVTPYSLVFAIWKFMPYFRSYQQQDAHEFLNSLIDNLDTELRAGGSRDAAPKWGEGLADDTPISIGHSRTLAHGASGGGLLGGGPPARQRKLDSSEETPAKRPRRAVRPRVIFSPPRDAKKPGGKRKAPAKTASKTKKTKKTKARAPAKPAPKVASNAKSARAAKKSADKAASKTKAARAPAGSASKVAATKPTLKSKNSAKVVAPVNRTKESMKPANKTSQDEEREETTRTPKAGKAALARKGGRAKKSSGKPKAKALGSGTTKRSSKKKKRAAEPTALACFPPSQWATETVSGKTVTLVTCSVCNTQSTRDEPFWALTIDIDAENKFGNPDGDGEAAQKPSSGEVPGAPQPPQGRSRRARLSRFMHDDIDRPREVTCSLYDCIRKTTAGEVLDGDSRYFCDSCGERVRAEKRVMVSKLPKVLIVHIMRACWHNRGRKEKLQHLVSFPLSELEMGGFCHKLPEGATSQYRLSSVVNHHGRGIDKGHYTAFCRDERRGGDDDWILFDDQSVSVATGADVKSSQAYLLFYERMDNID